MSLDHPVIDLCWRALWGLDTTSFRTASVVIPWKRSIICFFCVRSPRVVFHGSSLCSSWPAFGTHPDNSPSSFWSLQRLTSRRPAGVCLFVKRVEVPDLGHAK